VSDTDYQPDAKRRGRQKDTFQEEAFLQVLSDLEQTDEEQTTINDLLDNMKTYLGDSDSMPYGFTHMKKKIKDHYDDNILITEINGKSNVVTFTTTASKILYDFHQKSDKNDSIGEKMRLIEAAANLIKADIKSIIQSKDNYPTPGEMSADKAIDFVPDSLCSLLRVLIPRTNSDLKVASFGAGYCSGNTSKSVAMSSTARTWCATAPSLCLKVSDRFVKQAWVLLFLFRGSVL
jgi:hypothetical protein